MAVQANIYILSESKLKHFITKPENMSMKKTFIGFFPSNHNTWSIPDIISLQSL